MERLAHDAAPLPADPLAWLHGLLLLVVVQLPIEIPRSLIPDAPLVITNLELSLAILFTAFGLWKLRGVSREPRRRPRSRTRRLWRDPGGWVTLWLLALFVSALAAPNLNAHALKFALRSTLIAGLFFVSRSLHGPGDAGRRRLRLTMVVAGASATAVALAGCLEPLGWRSLETFLRLFRSVPTVADGSLRLTATFSYANQTGAYLALLLPIVAAGAISGRRAPRLLSIAAGGLIFWALMGTLSRAALVSGALGIATLVVGVWRAHRRAWILLAGLLILFGVRWTLDAPLRARHGGRLAEPALAAAYEAPESLRLAPQQIVRVPVAVRNLGSLTWTSRGLAPFHLSYHVIREGTDRSVPFDGARTPMPRIGPGDSALVHATLRAPAESGRYRIAWDLVREGVCWFSWIQVPPGQTRLEVSPRAGPALSGPAWERISESDLLSRVRPDSTALWQTAGRGTLWPIAWKIFRQRPWTGWGADTFRLRYAALLPAGRWDPRLHANNLFLELLATTGILGLGAWIALLIRLGRGARRGLPLLELALAATLVVFVLHGLLDSFLEFYGILGIFWIVAGARAGRQGSGIVHPDAVP